jgi:hypothetical protein
MTSMLETGSGTAPELTAMLAVSRLAARGGPLAELLDRIAAEAAGVVGARSASILLLDGPAVFRLAGSSGLSAGYAARLRRAPALAPGHGPSGLAAQRRRPVAIADTETDAEFAPWRPVARGEGYRAMVSVPLTAGPEMIGTLNVYRPTPGPWAAAELTLLAFFGEHAASAIRTASLIEHQTRQVDALARLVRGLREQTHEHANHLHAIRGLLALGEPEEALQFLERLETAHHVAYGSISGSIEHHVIAGLLLAETAVAQQRGITLEVDEASRLTRLPPRLTDADAVTIIGNLLENAFDAVSRLPGERRRVRLTVLDDGSVLTIRVVDRGPGAPPGSVRRGVSTKAGHAGVGLTLVQEAAAAAGGSLRVEGSAFTVEIPHG